MPEGRVKLHRGRHSDKLVVALRDAGDRGLTFTEQTKLFGNNVTAAQLRAIRCDLEATGRITTRSTRNYHGPATQRSYLIQHAPPEQFDANEPAGVSQ